MRSRPSVLLTTAIAGAASTLGLVAMSAASGPRIVVVNGDPAPDGNGFFLGAGAPAVNGVGQAAFLAAMTGTGASNAISGLFRGDGTSPPVQIARRGQAAPDGNGKFLSLGSPALNDAGQAAFYAEFFGLASGITARSGIFRGDGAAPPVQFVREGQSAPDGNGAFASFSQPIINSAGQVAFNAFFSGTSGGFRDDSGIFLGHGAGQLRTIVRDGQPAPGGNGEFSSISPPAFNNAGQVAFFANLFGTSGGNNDDRGLFRSDGIAPPVQIARRGQPAPDGNGLFEGFGNPILNDVGQAAFGAAFKNTSGNITDDAGLVRSDGITAPVQLVRRGQAVPDGNGTFENFVTLAMNNAGQAAFAAILRSTGSPLNDSFGIFTADGAGAPVQVARKGQPAPGGNGTFSAFWEPALNDAGQVVFGGLLTGTTGGIQDDFGIFCYDSVHGLVTVARKGDAFLGSTILELRYQSAGTLGNERSGLNNFGQLEYTYRLVNGGGGVAITNVIPEPAGLAALGLAGMRLLMHRRRRNMRTGAYRTDI